MRKPWARYFAVVIAATAIAVATNVRNDNNSGTTETPSSGQTANVWVNPAGAGGSPSRCSTPCEYNATNAYGSYSTAQTAAQAGDRINLKSGTYSSLSITKAVEIHPAPEETITVTGSISMGIASGGGSVDGGDVLGTSEVDRITAGGVSYPGNAPTDTGDPTVDRIVEDVKVAEGENIGIAGNHAVFRYGEMGPNDPCTQEEDLIFAGRPGTSGGPDVILNVQFIGNYIHGHGPNTACSGVHSDLFDVQLGDSLIAYNVFTDGCSTQCIFNSADSQNQADQQQNLDIVGNYFEQSQTIGIQCDGECHLAYNTFDTGLSPAYRLGPSGYTDATMTLTGNLWMETVSCESIHPSSEDGVVTHTYSMFITGSPCSGTGNTTGAVTLTGSGAGSGRVSSGSFSTIAGIGNPGECPPIDLDGQSRPQGVSGTCDIGADEVED